MINMLVTVKVRVREDRRMVPVDGAVGLLQTLPEDFKVVLEEYFEDFKISILEARIND